MKINARKTQFFSLALFWQGIRKISVPGIAMAISVIFINALFPIIAISSGAPMADFYPGATTDTVMLQPVDSFGEFAPLNILLLFFAPLLAFLMFSFLNDRGKSDFYHAIPQTRLCVFVSFTCSIVAWLTAVLLVSSGLNLLLWQASPYHVLNYSEVLALIPCILLGALLVMAFALLGMMLTGTVVSNLFVTVLLFIVLRVVLLECFEAFGSIAPVFSIDDSWTRLLSLDNYYPVALFLLILSGASYYAGTIFDGGIILYTLGLTLVLLVLAALGYHRRRSEIANQSAPNRMLQHVYRCAVSLPLLLWCVLDAFEWGLGNDLLWLFALSLVVYILYELITTKRIRTMVRSLPIFGILLLACVAIYGGLQLAGAAVRADVPDRDEVTSVAISPSRLGLSDDRFDFDDTELENREAIDIVMEALEFSAPFTMQEYRDYRNSVFNDPNATKQETMSQMTLTVAITTESGQRKYRDVWMNEDRYQRLKELCYDDPDILAQYLSIPEKAEIYSLAIRSEYSYDQLSPYETALLWECFSREYAALSTGTQLLIKQESSAFAGSALPSLVVYGFNDSETILISPRVLPETASMMLSRIDHSGTKSPEQLCDTVDALDTAELTEFLEQNEGYYYPNFHIMLHPASDYGVDGVKDMFPRISGISLRDEPESLDVLKQFVDAVQGVSDPFAYETLSDRTRSLYFISLGLYDVPEKLTPDGNTHFSFDGYILLTDAEAQTLLLALQEAASALDIDY